MVDHEQILDNLPVVCMRLTYEDRLWKTWFVTRNVERYGYSRQDFLDGKVTWIDMVHPDDRLTVHSLAHEYMTRNLDDFKLHYRILSKNGDSTWITEHSHVNRDRNGALWCVDSMLQSTTEAVPGKDALRDNERQQVVLNDILMALHDGDVSDPLAVILERAGAYLNCSRARLFKDEPERNLCLLMHEWRNRGITALNDSGHPSKTRLPEVHAALQKTGMCLISAGAVPEGCKRAFTEQGLMASASYAVHLHGEPFGFVSFDDCVIERTWDDDTAVFLKNISNILSTVLMRMHSEEELMVSRRTCETVLDNVDSYIFAEHPVTGEIVFANRAFRRVFGSQCIGMESGRYLALTPVGSPEDSGSTHAEADEDMLRYEAYLGLTGQWLSVTKELVSWVDGRTVFLVNCHDITESKHYEERIKFLAFSDHLTRLPNRSRCEHDLAGSIEKARRAAGKGYVLFLDLDDFKVVNDSFGHDYGDGVLISFASFLRELFTGDTHVYRFGGDEFVIIINHSYGHKVNHYLHSLLERAKKPWRSMDKEFYCSVSIGVVEFPAEDDTVKSIQKKADIAMYQSKQAGKNSFTFYTEGLESDTIQRSAMEALLRESMRNNFQGFELHYQPYRDVRTGAILGAEALVRMRSPEGGLLLPEEFIPLAEYLGFIVPLGEQVLKEAAMQCKAINDAGRPDFSMTVNLSAKQFKQMDLVSRLEHVLDSTGVVLGNMIVGINEGMAIGELTRMLELCPVFRERGIRVALDDFGSGSSSFINMRNLPVDMIKVSSRYIDTIDDEFTGYFIRLVKDLSHLSGKLVCVNGVETEAQYAFCRDMGVDMVQGFLFHRPGSVDALTALLK